MSYVRRGLSLTLALMLISLLSINVTNAQDIIPLPAPQDQREAYSRPEKITNFAQAFAPSGVRVPDDYPQWYPPAANAPRVPPTNDNFANAYDFGTFTGTPLTSTVTAVDEATMEQNELFFCDSRYNSIWFKFAVASDTVIDIDTSNSTFDTHLTLYRSPSGSNLAFKECNDDEYDNAAALLNTSVKAGTYYVQVMNSGDSPLGSPSDATITISLASAAVPRPFYLYAPYTDIYAAVPYFFNWGQSSGATSYDFTIERIASPNSGNPLEIVVEDNGLTPEADADELDCTTDYGCIYLIPASLAANLTADGDIYAWSVMAVNNNGYRDGTGSTTPTTIEFELDFTVLPPPTYANYPAGTYITAPNTFDWNHVIGADTYNFIVETVNSRAVIFNMIGLTPAVDGDILDCDPYYYTCYLVLTEEQTAQLVDDTSYAWRLESVNENGSTPSQSGDRYFRVDSTPLPGEFYLYYPEYFVQYVDYLSQFRFDHSDYATTYDLTISNSTPTDIIVKTGLTAVEGDDQLDCYANAIEANRSCAFSPSPAELALFTDGDYTWNVTAHNANGDTPADGSGSFRLDTTLGYDLLTPADGSEFANETLLTSFSWEEILTVGWTAEYYTIYNEADLFSQAGNIMYLTPAADFDRLTCAGGTCTLNITAVEFGNVRGQYYWTAIAGGIYDAAYRYLYPAGEGFGYTIGETPENDQLLLNDSFEDAATRANFPAGWEAKNLTSGAGQKCNKDKDGDGIPDKVVANPNYGACAFMMKGIGSTGKLQQTVDTTGILQGDSLTLGAYYNTKNTAAEGAPEVKLTVKYADTNVEKTKVSLEIPAGTSNGFVYLEDTAVLSSAPNKIKVQLRYKGVGGKVYFDPVWLWLEIPAPRNGVLALPDSTSNSLQNNQGSERLGSRQ